jgi:hypothetical protein
MKKVNLQEVCCHALKRFRVKAKATQNATPETPTSKLRWPATLLGHWSKNIGLTNSTAAVKGKKSVTRCNQSGSCVRGK